ncbi:siroheme synthase CysG [Sphingosinicella sp. CPCC 101087]|uniref:siroheme synthase CysG n=1 Tax=Sphingosinicella sp. CPCC 101087 TaxID=2497754 RepID=UPI0013EA53BF|nr:siroheme synthase CysG [Sphingosinicella sp. CPCC 101087]
MSKTRNPEAVRPPRIAALPNLPLFHKVEGRKTVVAGGGAPALWKAELLAAAGADVLVLAGDGAADFAALAADPPAGRLVVEPRAWRESDLDGAVLAFGDLGDPGEAERFVAAARARRVPVNVIDQTELCDFQVGTIVNRSPVVLAISTDGAAPMLGQSIRARIESVLPLGLSGWARAAQAWRPRVKSRFATFADRRRFWERFTRLAWEKVDRSPSEFDREALFEDVAREAPRGRVTLVGAGPGDPELLTLKAVRALQSATVILFDDLVGPEVLELARREAVRIAVGKAGHGPSVRQSDICRRIVELAQAGENVVRLKGGDPLIFGRATEEVEACRAAGIDVSVVPGISAAQGAAAALGFSLTERMRARRVQFVTGHGADGKLPRDLDWASIADPVATTALYMPRRTLAEFVRAAMAHGLGPDTPAAAIASATLPAQQHVAGRLVDLPALAETLRPGAPVVVIVGEVVRGLPASELSAAIQSSAA